MKTAKILRKSVLTPGNNWITLLNSANLIKKNAVTPVNFHLYHYAGNNPVRYTDPDGRKVATLLCFEQQNSAANKDLNMGKTPNGRFDESGNIRVWNKIGSYGCKFISTINIANTIRKSSRECRDAVSVSDYTNKDEYFFYSNLRPYLKNEGWSENDALMGDAQMKKLLKDTTGIDFEISHYTTFINFRIRLIHNHTKRDVYLMARVQTIYGEHFIDLYWDSEKNCLDYHDTYDWLNSGIGENKAKQIQDDIAKQIQDGTYELIVIQRKNVSE